MKKIILTTLLLSILQFISFAQIPTMVKDINVGASGSMSGSRLAYLTNYDGSLFFSASNSLQKSDGTAAGTVLISNDFSSGTAPSYKYTSFNNELYFWRWEFPGGNSALWKTDGTTSGTVKVKTIITGSSSYQIEKMVVSNGLLFFTIFTPAIGTELWKSDGTEAGTSIVKDINPGSANGLLRNLFSFKNKVYFMANDGTSGFELWSSDGTSAGTNLVKELVLGAGNSNPDYFLVFNDELYFFTNNGLWKTDGTEAGTIQIKNNLYVRVERISQFFSEMNGSFYFTASTTQNANGELWKSDGTAAGTVLVKDINPGTASSVIQYMINVNGTLFFAADNGLNGKELWKSDGTNVGTIMVKDINPGTGNGIDNSQQIFFAHERLVYFSANNGTNGYELWKSDGTEAGTVMVADINPGAGSSTPDGFEKLNNFVYFSADNGVNGRELWKMSLVPEAIVHICTTPILSNFAGQGETNVPYYIFSLESKNVGSQINQISLRTAGSYSQSDIVNFKLFKNNIPNLLGATQIASLSPTSGVPEVLSFTISENLAVNTPVYFIATADISPTAFLSPTPGNLESNAHVKSTLAVNPLNLTFSSAAPIIVDNQPFNQNITFEQKYELTKGFYVKNPQFTIDGTASTTNISSKAYVSLVQNGAIFKTVEILNGSYNLGSVYDGIYDLVLHKTASGSTIPQLPDGYTSFTAERFDSGPADAVADGKIAVQISGDYIGSARISTTQSVIFELAASPLPLNLLSFGAKQLEKEVNLTWRTTTETNFSHFEIQKSNNSKEFGAIGKVNGNQTSIYSFTDTNPSESQNYYRLKMIDLDGSIAFSKTIAVDYEKNGYYFSVENPAKNGEFVVKSNYINPQFSLLNSLGQKMDLSVYLFTKNEFILKTNGIGAGLYFLMMEAQGKVQTRKLIVE